VNESKGETAREASTAAPKEAARETMTQRVSEALSEGAIEPARGHGERERHTH
jgi:hypothetical protein